MFGKLKSFGRSQLGVAKSHPILFAVFLLVVVAFGGGVIVNLYNKARATVPGGSKLPAPKVAAAA